MLSFAITTLLAAVCAVNAANFTVDVGSDGALAFNNNSITAAVGDTVSFQFQSGNHSVTQSTFANPCTRMSGGFGSGFHSTSATQFTITVNDTKPIWYYCGQTQPLVHCHVGMVGAINAATTGNATFAAFQSAAKALASSSSSSTSAASTASSAATVGASGSASGDSSSASAASTPTASAAAMQIGGSSMGALTAMALLVGLAL